MVVKGNIHEKIINMIIIISLLLAICVVADYATNITNISSNVTDNITVNDSTKVLGINDSMIITSSNDKLYTETVEYKKKKKSNVPTVTITSKPSCGCNYGYYWHTMTFKSYCPHCHKTGTIRNVHKWPARYEQELTCDPKLGGCGADYCGCCGKEKYSYSRYYITKA